MVMTHGAGLHHAAVLGSVMQALPSRRKGSVPVVAIVAIIVILIVPVIVTVGVTAIPFPRDADLQPRTPFVVSRTTIPRTAADLPPELLVDVCKDSAIAYREKYCDRPLLVGLCTA